MIRDVTIHAVGNGYVVTVGCQTFVFNAAAVMLQEIGAYLADPEGTEKRYQEREFNMRHTLNTPPPLPPALRSEVAYETTATERADYALAGGANRRG